ncbi:hypothetical protein [Macrococcoides caseolyticum]|uniref:hypothetical protein n=1 Tax=Macrococcoides caseolyticum TaxID=69966 RepID=UPI001F3D31FE|nr:hypothetical protein [Macrococcus caseolyticus]MCE4957893.1 hypothetical protein [Macrococcus caseolyticus]
MQNYKKIKKITVIATTSVLGVVGILNHSVAVHADELNFTQTQLMSKQIQSLRGPALRFLEGVAYYDENNDGVSESLVVNTDVDLIGEDGSVISGRTDDNGNFYFEGMLLGDFTLRFYLNVVDENGVASIDVIDTPISIVKNIANRIQVTIAPTPDTPTTETPTTEVPTTETPTTETPTTELPTTEIPTTELPTTELPTTEIPTIELPTTELLTTELPTTEIPTIELPTTELPTTELPTTEIPTIELPTIELPTMEIPTPEEPIVGLPSVELPTAEIPTTETPVIMVPSTQSPIENPVIQLPLPNQIELGDVEESVIFVEPPATIGNLPNPYHDSLNPKDELNNGDIRLESIFLPIQLPDQKTIVDKPINNQEEKKTAVNNEQEDDLEVAKSKKQDNKQSNPKIHDIDNGIIAQIDDSTDVSLVAMPTFISGLGGFND